MYLKQYIAELQHLADTHGDDLLVVSNTTSDIDFLEISKPEFLDLDTLDVYDLRTDDSITEVIEKVIVV